MSYIFKKGATSQSIEVYIIDSTNGTPETGVTFETAGIDLKYRRKDALVVSITEADLTTPDLEDTWETGGFLEIGNGVYRLDLPDAALASASGIDRVVVFGTVTGMVVLPITIHLTDIDLNTALASSTIGTCTTNTDMVGTDGAALAAVVGALADAAADGAVTEADTLMKYIKQLINILIGAPGVVAFPAEAAPANGVSLAEVIRAIAIDVATTIPGTITTAQTELDKIGTIPALDGGAQTIGGAIAKLADDNGGADFDAGTDSLQKIRDRGDAAWAGAPESVSGTVVVDTADTIFDLTATLGTLSGEDDTYNNMIICILDNSGSVYETARITDYDGTNTRITIDHELTFPVQDGVDTFVIYRAAYAPVGAASITEGDMNTIVDKIFDELMVDHQISGSGGYHLKRAGQRY